MKRFGTSFGYCAPCDEGQCGNDYNRFGPKPVTKVIENTLVIGGLAARSERDTLAPVHITC